MSVGLETNPSPNPTHPRQLGMPYLEVLLWPGGVGGSCGLLEKFEIRHTYDLS